MTVTASATKLRRIAAIGAVLALDITVAACSGSRTANPAPIVATGATRVDPGTAGEISGTITLRGTPPPNAVDSDER